MGGSGFGTGSVQSISVMDMHRNQGSCDSQRAVDHTKGAFKHSGIAVARQVSLRTSTRVVAAHRCLCPSA